jgi:hypothetical protein
MATEQDIINSILAMREIKPPLQYDPEKLMYNEKYKSFEFFADKFPDGWQNIPGFEKIIEQCRQNAVSPLEEMNARIQMALDSKKPDEEQLNKVIDLCQQTGILSETEETNLRTLVDETINEYKEYIEHIDVTINELTDNTSDLN